jgi:hypothetical protein
MRDRHLHSAIGVFLLVVVSDVCEVATPSDSYGKAPAECNNATLTATEKTNGTPYAYLIMVPRQWWSWRIGP